MFATPGDRRWLRGPWRLGPTTLLFCTPIAIGCESPKPLAGLWHPAQELSLCNPRILSKNKRRPSSTFIGSSGLPNRAGKVDSIRPLNPASRRTAWSCASRSSLPARASDPHNRATDRMDNSKLPKDCEDLGPITAIAPPPLSLERFLVLRTANAAPVWRGGNGCFDRPYDAVNRIRIAAKLN